MMFPLLLLIVIVVVIFTMAKPITRALNKSATVIEKKLITDYVYFIYQATLEDNSIVLFRSRLEPETLDTMMDNFDIMGSLNEDVVIYDNGELYDWVDDREALKVTELLMGVNIPNEHIFYYKDYIGIK